MLVCLVFFCSKRCGGSNDLGMGGLDVSSCGSLCDNFDQMQWGYLIEFCVDDFGVLVPVVDVDPHLCVTFCQYTHTHYKNKKHCNSSHTPS